MATETHARKAKKFPNIYDLIGGAAELLETELPTLKQCLQYGLLIEERRVEQLTVRDKFKKVASKVVGIWQSVHPLMPVVKEKWLIDRLSLEWGKAKQLVKKRSNKPKLQTFLDTLDKLFDICLCKCRIFECKDFDCPGCDAGAHTTCRCPKDNKVPVEELSFLRMQRSKVGGKSGIQIGPVDSRTSNVVAKRVKRKSIDSIPGTSKYSKASSSAPLPSSSTTESSDSAPNVASESSDDNQACPETNARIDVSKIAAAAVRYGVSNLALAAISTATLSAAKDAGLLDKVHLIDQNRMKRAKDRLIREARQDNRRHIQGATICGLLFDGRKDDTRVMSRGEDGIFTKV